jgi:hypothetical protein
VGRGLVNIADLFFNADVFLFDAAAAENRAVRSFLSTRSSAGLEAGVAAVGPVCLVAPAFPVVTVGFRAERPGAGFSVYFFTSLGSSSYNLLFANAFLNAGVSVVFEVPPLGPNERFF